MDINMGLKCFLKEQRKKRAITQEDLAKMVNVRRETIVRLETGQYNPSLELALKIARAIDVPLEDIFRLE